MRLSRKLRLRLATLACAMGCLIVLIALLSAPSPASYTDHKAFGTGAGDSGPSGSEQSGAGDTPSSHSHQDSHSAGGIVPDAHTTEDSDPDFGDGYTFAENSPWGTNSGSSGQGGHPYPGNSDSNFGDGRGFGGGGGFGGFGGFGGYFPPGAEPGKQDGGDGSEESGDSPPLTTASLFLPGSGTDTDQSNKDAGNPEDGPDYTPPTLAFDDPSIDKITEDLPSDPPGGDKPDGRAPVQVPEPSSWSMLVLALLGLAFWRMRATRQASFH